MTPPAPSTTDEPVNSNIRRRLMIALGVLCLVALAGFWGWIWVYQLSNHGERDMPDRLDDLAWTSTADEICEVTEQRLAQLPPAHTVATADERADIIDDATNEVEQMLQSLESIVPTGSSRDARITAAWIADYREFLQDRHTYADTLRRDPGARFLVTEKYGSHITAPIDRFARVNEMERCMTPGDV